MKRSYIVALLTIIMLVGCATTPETPPEEPPAVPEVPEEPAEEVVEEPSVGGDIQILNRAFDPEELTVSAGSTVSWINMDEVAVHSLSIVGEGTVCSRKKAGEICEYTFEEAGTYEVMDLPNKFRGTIIVTGGETG